ncbi:MAG TPA: single-stranded DNA-binding protein [Thermoanaerobaculia bacterium]|nr:single-stranded DNA-binding protein [Thermoanaerobaculia bacterium]
MNRVILCGHLGKDPKVGEKNGRAYVLFSLATNEVWFDESGAKHERTDWHWVTCFNGQAKGAQKLQKGDRVLIEGKLRTSRREKEGVEYDAVQVLAEKIDFMKLKSREDIEPEPSELGDDDDVPF